MDNPGWRLRRGKFCISMRMFSITFFKDFLSKAVQLVSPQHSKTAPLRFGHSAPLVVVSREYCFETEKEFPIAEPSECVKAASMMTGLSPLSGPSFYLVDKVSVDKCRVFIFTIDEDVYQKVSKTGWLILPESLLVKCWLDRYYRNETVHLTYALEGREYHALAQHGRLRTWHNLGGRESALALAMAPETSEAKTVELSEAELHNAFKQSLRCIPGRVFLQGFNSERLKVGLAKVNWRAAGAAIASIVTLYLLLTSAFLYMYNSATHNQLTEQREELNEVFRIQRNLEFQQSAIETLTSKAESSPPVSGAWKVVLELLRPKDVELLTFRFENNKFTIRARAEKATVIVERLTGLDETDNVEIASPVVNSRGREIVTVTFNYIDQGGNEKGLIDAE